MDTQQTLDSVKNYYGQVLKSSSDLKTSACCSVDSLPMEAREIFKDLHDEVKDRFYGCGSPFPPALKGRQVLDLGCGSGRDVYLLSKMVGEEGSVIGVDMTEEQLEVARRHQEYHYNKFGFSKSNVEFKLGYIEDLQAAGIDDESVDLVVSNCVTNLSPDKPRLFSEIWRVLREGGELYFSDVFASRRLEEQHRKDPILLGECLGGAMYIEDFRRLISDLGCKDFRMMSATPIDLLNEEIQDKVSDTQFYSITYRIFKMDLEDRCEDYGQVAYYNGEIPGFPHSFALDDHHLFQTNKPRLVCGNTADMLSKSHYAPFFKIEGTKDKHFGLFDCGPISVTKDNSTAPGACC
jgi:ubiquinone/menaquinone biosynthesis C-methylase UbiE